MYDRIARLYDPFFGLTFSMMLRVCAPGGQILIADLALPSHDTWHARVV